MNETIIMLDEKDFDCLVRGGVLSINGGSIQIALRDIGFDRMDVAISLAERGIDTYKGHEKVIK